MEARGRPKGFHSAVRRIFGAVAHGLKNPAQGWVGRRREKRLRLRETLSLGDRRFLAVVQFDQQELLVGGTGSSLALLAQVQGGATTLKPPASHEPDQS